MLSKTHRLSKKKDFDTIFKNPAVRVCYAKLMGGRALPNQSAQNRFGIIISSKISKKAVERNRLKRQGRQALKELDKEMARGYDLVIIALPKLLNSPYQEIQAELEKIIIKLKLKKPDRV